MKGYNLYSVFSLVVSLLYTKIFHRSARLIRLPCTIRGAKYIRLGSGFVAGRYCRIDALSDCERQIVIGSNCQINDSVHIAAIESICIGDNVLLASRVFITDHQHGDYSGDDQSNPIEIVAKRRLSSKPVKIFDNVWLGEGVVVMPGVTIGENSIIGANSVVTKDIPENSIACGVPAKVIKVYDFASGSWISRF